MELIEEIKTVVNKLDEIEKYGNSLNGAFSTISGKEQDLLHYVEKNKISVVWCYKFIKELQKVRQERRKIKNDMELTQKFNAHINKLISSDNRQFLMAEMYKKEKQLQTEYKNRIYTEEELNRILKK